MRKTRVAKAICSLVAAVGVFVGLPGGAQSSVPLTEITALDAHAVQLPRDLSPATIFIVGFSRGSENATTAWEIPVRQHLASSRVGFYDVAVLASVPSFVRGWVTRSLRKKVPPVLQPRFLPVYADEVAWKAVCGYDEHAPDAAYIVVTDRSGKVLWTTHEPYSTAMFTQLANRSAM